MLPTRDPDVRCEGRVHVIESSRTAALPGSDVSRIKIQVEQPHNNNNNNNRRLVTLAAT